MATALNGSGSSNTPTPAISPLDAADLRRTLDALIEAETQRVLSSGYVPEEARALLAAELALRMHGVRLGVAGWHATPPLRAEEAEEVRAALTRIIAARATEAVEALTDRAYAAARQTRVALQHWNKRRPVNRAPDYAARYRAYADRRPDGLRPGEMEKVEHDDGKFHIRFPIREHPADVREQERIRRDRERRHQQQQQQGS